MVKALNAFFLILIFSLVSSALLLHGASVLKYAERSAAEFRTREAALHKLNAIVSDMGALTGEAADYYENSVLRSLIASHSLLTLTDVSSGIKPDFMNDAVLSNPVFEQFFFKSGSDSFITFRNRFGLTSNKEAWKDYLTEDGFACAAAYGWLAKADSGTFAFQTIASIWGSSYPEALFPLVNDLPKINVNTVNPKLLLPLCAAMGVNADKSNMLKTRLESSCLDESELEQILGLPADHGIYRMFGVKTTFWQLRFYYGGSKKIMEAVVAAIPYHGENKIASYQAIEWSFTGES
jgi:hypothetical protein